MLRRISVKVVLSDAGCPQSLFQSAVVLILALLPALGVSTTTHQQPPAPPVPRSCCNHYLFLPEKAGGGGLTRFSATLVHQSETLSQAFTPVLAKHSEKARQIRSASSSEG